MRAIMIRGGRPPRENLAESDPPFQKRRFPNSNQYSLAALLT